MNHHLPSELLESIIDHLAEDPHALAACSLASSVFLDKSRTYLFRNITLSTSSKHPRESQSHTGPFSSLLHKVSSVTQHSSRNRCHALHSLLRRSPHLGTYVRALSIDVDKRSPTSILAEPTLKEVFSFLVNLSSLEIRGITFWEELHQCGKDALAYAFGMRSLTHITFDGGDLYADILPELTESLKSLVLNRTILYTYPQDSKDAKVRKKTVANTSREESEGVIYLESLTIIEYYTRIYDGIAIFAERVLHTPGSKLNLSRIRSLKLSAPLVHLVPATQQVIEACSQSVENICFTEEHSDLEQALDLSNCKKLKILNLTYHLYSPGTLHIVPSWWCPTLSTITGGLQRTEIYIHSEYSLEYSLKKSDIPVGDKWRELGVLLGTACFGEVSVLGDDKVVEDTLKGELNAI